MHVRPTRPAVVRNGDHEDDGFDRGAPAEQLGADAVQPTAGPAKRTGRRSRRSRHRFDTWRRKQRVSSFELSESATGVPSGSTAHLLLLQKPEKEQATKFEVLSTCPADEQPVPQLESDTEDPELKGLASLAECKCCPGCGAKADFLECEFCGAWMCDQCLGEHIWLNHFQAERLREHTRRDQCAYGSHFSTP